MEQKNYIIAIDLGSSNVAVAVAERNSDSGLTLLGIVTKPAQGVKAGLIDNIELVSTAVRSAVTEIEEQLGIRIAEAYTGLSGEFVRCARHKDFVFTQDPQNGISRQDVDALFERMRNVQAPDDETIMERIPQNYLVDDTQEVQNPVGSFGRRLASTFNFILCTKTPIERLGLALRRLGIRSLGTCANAPATAEAVLTPEEKEEGAVLVDIGGGITDVAVYYRNVLRYIATIPMGADAINADIRTLGIPRHIDNLKCKYGWALAEMAPDNKMISVKGRTARETKDILLRNLAVVIEARATDIAEYVLQEIKDSGFEGKLAYGIVLTGGSAKLQGIDELFRRITKMEVRIGNGSECADEATRSKAEDPALSTVMGLLLYGARHGACSVDDLPRQNLRPGFGPSETDATPRIQPVRPSVSPQTEPSIPRSEPQPNPVPEPQPEPGTKPTPIPDRKPGRDWGGIFKKALEKINDSFNGPEDEEI